MGTKRTAREKKKEAVVAAVVRQSRRTAKREPSVAN